jgi:outer membrane protein assembly factor BamD (BamD/ComL family)
MTVSCWLRSSLLLGCLAFGAAAEDRFAAWLATPPAQREAERDDRMRAARRAGEVWLAAYLELLGIADPAKRATAADRLVTQTPADRRPWVILAQAQAELAAHQAERALALLEPEWQMAQGRVRYECDRVMADILTALERPAEAADLAKEAQDLASRVLYADPGINAGGLDQLANPEDPAAALYRQADEARERSDWPVALERVAQISAKHAASPWHAPAQVLRGWVLVGQGKPKDADAHWAAFIATSPVGPWRGVAQVARIDCALEIACDQAQAAAGVAALGKQILARADAQDDTGRPGDGWAGMVRERELRLILLDLVANRQAEATARAQALLGTGPDQSAGQPDDQGVYQPATGIGKLLDRLAKGQPLTDPRALVTGRDAVNLRLVLADWWILLDEPLRARRILAHVLAERSPATPDQRVYARMHLADLDYAAWKHEDFRAGYERALKDRPQNPWAARQHLVLAVDQYSRQDHEQQALARLTLIQRQFPGSAEAQTAGWYRGVIAWWGHRWSEAAAAWDDLDKRHPNHPWRDFLAQDYRPRLADIAARKLTADDPPPPRPGRAPPPIDPAPPDQDPP